MLGTIVSTLLCRILKSGKSSLFSSQRYAASAFSAVSRQSFSRSSACAIRSSQRLPIRSRSASVSSSIIAHPSAFHHRVNSFLDRHIPLNHARRTDLVDQFFRLLFLGFDRDNFAPCKAEIAERRADVLRPILHGRFPECLSLVVPIAAVVL